MNGESLNIKEDNLNKLKSVLPEVFSEDKVDWEKLKAHLGDTIVIANERYTLNWAGKSDAFKALQQPTTATLKPAPEESIDFETTGNVFIEGENLEVLKVLQKSYYGKVKCIIIDPPYNTGSDSFIYPDSFKENKADYEKRIGDKDEDGYLMKEGYFRKNSKDSGHFHSNWLSMMYPRLFLAKNLMRDDGVIFIHIDSNEVQNLRLVMNEIFGEENFIECITWNKRVPKNDKGIGSIHEYVLIFVKNSIYKHEFTMQKNGLEEIDELLSKLKKKEIPLPEAEDEIQKLYNKKGYDRGITLYNSLNSDYRLWGKINMSWPNANTFGPRYEVKHPKSGKAVKVPDRGWRWKEDTFNTEAKIVDGKYQSILELHDGTYMCGRIWFDKDENTQPSSINYLDELDTLLLRSIISLKSDGGIEVEKIFEGKSYFSYPKPTSLAKILINSIKLSDDDIVLDFFAGSGTNAHAVLDLNSEDGINRKFIMVQLPEPCAEDSEAFKAGFKTISSISQERIRRVIKSHVQENLKPKQLGIDLGQNAIGSKLSKENKKGDLGLKVFKLSSSNFKIWRGNDITEENLATQLDAFTNPVKEGSETDNMFYELLLKAGYQLTDKVDKRLLFYSVKDNELIIVFDKMAFENAEIIVKAIPKPKKVITLDNLFAGNDQLKTNTVLQMKDAGIDFKTV
ncbi:MAG: site-specific DNA-methyltransferase [Cytophagales bacterium]|jgi:adenine-specific DNA-methyltransferase|nr:site-specific DNA-methyltransferase [Cytophagales bacterium]MCA6389346.1 site-specific DNA-methyltransferase [Cytophagales bacterium]MCA6393497.1 site-specific DNA-methyltransferase [Cytophagales bacterium]MCA6394826.1 site-specific DNA-methyltransferase [Cytophagales bacterium]MCA6403355.1 site-specific DNA-methyltransferase [Cytophagales bacterium]